MRLYLVGRLTDDQRRRLAERCPDVTVVAGDGAAGGGDLDAALVWEADTAGLLPALRARPDLPWVHTSFAGIPPALLDALAGRPTLLTNGSGAHAPAIAEWVVASLLAFAKRSHELRARQARANWAGGTPLAELGGQTAGIVGLGDVGLAIARLLRAFGVRVLGMRRRPEPSPAIDALYARAALPDFLAQLDILILAAPLTAETAGLIGAAELARLRPGARVVNVARGALLDEAALIAALRSGHLGGAALDVFAEEPLPPSSPLWALPNVILSPHCCDNTPQTLARGFALFLDNLERFRRGEPLRNVVDRAAGY